MQVRVLSVACFYGLLVLAGARWFCMPEAGVQIPYGPLLLLRLYARIPIWLRHMINSPVATLPVMAYSTMDRSRQTRR